MRWFGGTGDTPLVDPATPEAWPRAMTIIASACAIGLALPLIGLRLWGQMWSFLAAWGGPVVLPLAAAGSVPGTSWLEAGLVAAGVFTAGHGTALAAHPIEGWFAECPRLDRATRITALAQAIGLWAFA